MNDKTKRKPHKMLKITLFVLGVIIVTLSIWSTPGHYHDQSLRRVEIPLLNTDGAYFFHGTTTIQGKQTYSGQRIRQERGNTESEYTFEIPVRENTWFKTWYKYAHYLGASARNFATVDGIPKGEILSVTIEITDISGKTLHSKNVIYSYDGSKIVHNDQKEMRGMHRIFTTIKRRAFFRGEKPMLVRISINSIRPNTFTRDAYLLISTWSVRRCRHIECILD